jgi:hypothetical protein
MRQAALCFGEPHVGFEPEISEWESYPARDCPKGQGTQGTKTFYYLQEEKSIEMR